MAFRTVLAIILMCCAIVSVVMGVASRPEVLLLEMPESVDLGEMPAGSRRSVDVDITNPCSFAIEILQVTSSCGCTSAKCSQSIVPAGDAITLSIEIAADEGGADGTVQVSYHPVHGSVTAKRSVRIHASPVAKKELVSGL